MTVIAWDGKTLAADKRACVGSLVRTTTKIFRIQDALVAYAGDAGTAEELKMWFASGEGPEKFPLSARDKENYCGLLVIRVGLPILRYERSPYPVSLEDEKIAMGSGRDFAMAALYLGKTAKEAVEIAIALDYTCGNGIDILEF